MLYTCQYEERNKVWKTKMCYRDSEKKACEFDAWKILTGLGSESGSRPVPRGMKPVSLTRMHELWACLLKTLTSLPFPVADGPQSEGNYRKTGSRRYHRGLWHTGMETSSNAVSRWCWRGELSSFTVLSQQFAPLDILCVFYRFVSSYHQGFFFFLRVCAYLLPMWRNTILQKDLVVLLCCRSSVSWYKQQIRLLSLKHTVNPKARTILVVQIHCVKSHVSQQRVFWYWRKEHWSMWVIPGVVKV